MEQGQTLSSAPPVPSALALLQHGGHLPVPAGRADEPAGAGPRGHRRCHRGESCGRAWPRSWLRAESDAQGCGEGGALHGRGGAGHSGHCGPKKQPPVTAVCRTFAPLGAEPAACAAPAPGGSQVWDAASWSVAPCGSPGGVGLSRAVLRGAAWPQAVRTGMGLGRGVSGGGGGPVLLRDGAWRRTRHRLGRGRSEDRRSSVSCVGSRDRQHGSRSRLRRRVGGKASMGGAGVRDLWGARPRLRASLQGTGGETARAASALCPPSVARLPGRALPPPQRPVAHARFS